MCLCTNSSWAHSSIMNMFMLFHPTDFLTYSDAHSDFTDSTPLEILNEIPHESSLNHRKGTIMHFLQHSMACVKIGETSWLRNSICSLDGKRRDHTEKEESLNQSPKEQTTFALLPVPDTCRHNHILNTYCIQQKEISETKHAKIM